MTAVAEAGYAQAEALHAETGADPLPETEAFAELKRGVHAALETYSNVHRGSGHASMATTELYEQARDIVLNHLGLAKNRYTVIFCSPRRAEALKAQLKPDQYRIASSEDLGLSLGVRALAVDRGALPRGAPVHSGGGTARLVSPGWVIWAKTPDRFEAGTPAIINVIAFAKALRLTEQYGDDAFQNVATGTLTAADILRHDELESYMGHDLAEALRQTLIGRDVRVPTAEGTRAFINLDNAASTPTFAPIWDAVWQTWQQPRPTQLEIIDAVKSICLEALGASRQAYDVIFTSNTTEAINVVADSLIEESRHDTKPVVLDTFLEHNSNELPWRTRSGLTMIRLPVDPEGFMDLSALEALLRAYNQEHQHGQHRIELVAVSGASNVLGVFNDLAEISRIVHQYGARLLVDAAQLVAHRKVEIERWGIDYLACSAHKAYAPFGCGALLARKGMLAFSQAELDLIRSSGEENAGGIAALGKALVLLQRIGLDVIQAEEQALTARLLRGLAGIPNIQVYGVKDPDSPRFAHKGGVVIFDLNGVIPGRVARDLAERGGIGVRSGCHCAHLAIKRVLNIPPLLEQFQWVIVTLFPQLSLPGVVRVSLGLENTAEDVDAFLDALGVVARKPHPGSPRQSGFRAQMEEFTAGVARKVYRTA